jgi:hypothetical protein
LVSHLVNSVLLVLVFAMLIEPNLDWSRPWAGLAWGVVLALVLAGALLAPLSGLGFMGLKTRNLRFAATNVVMHVVWGLVVGGIYVAR